MGIGASLVLIAAGAILDFGVTVSDSHGFNLHTIGLILMIIGGIGLLVSLIFWTSWGGFGGYRRRDVEAPPARRVYHDEY
jgi:hypothetical protein